MTAPSQPEMTTSRRPSGAGRLPTKDARRIQFSLFTLLLAMVAIGIGCWAVRVLGAVWLAPVVLVVVSVAHLALAVRSGLDLRMLKLGHGHCAIWLALAAAASGLAVRGCLEYNEIAGTDKTPLHIVQISAATLAGPMVGPVANSAAGQAAINAAWSYTAVLFSALFLSLLPFLVVRRIASAWIALICWTLFIAATVLWFFGAMISLGVFLS
jgi:hypothetical protein